MDTPLFNPNENEVQTTPEVQYISLNLNDQAQNQRNDSFIPTPSDSPKIQTPQLIDDNNNKSNTKVKRKNLSI